MEKVLLSLLITLFLSIPAIADNSSISNQKATSSELKAILTEANHNIVENREKSMELYKQALKIDPTSDEANYNVGVLYLFKDQPEESLDYLINTLKYNPKYILAYSAITANCDALGYYDLTSEYIAKYRKEFPEDKRVIEIANKMTETSNEKKEYSQKLVSFIKPSISINLAAPKWILGYKGDTEQIQLSQLIQRGKTVDTTPEALTFTELKGLSSKFFSSRNFAVNYSNHLKRTKNANLKFNILEANDKYTIFETSFPGQYDIFKCVLGKSSIYMVNYTLKPENISDIKKQYWLNVIKKADFTEIN